MSFSLKFRGDFQVNQPFFFSGEKIINIFLGTKQAASVAGKFGGFPLPIGSMYGLFTYIWLMFMVSVGKYTIHGSYGL